MEIIRFRLLGRHLQVWNFSFRIFRFLFFRTNLLTSSLHCLNQSAMLLIFPYLGVDSCRQIRRRGLRSAQPQWLWRSTHFRFPISASPSDFCPVPAWSLPPTPLPSPLSAESAGGLVTLPPLAKKRHKPVQSALSFTTVPPTDVLTKAVRKEVLRSLW